MAIVVSHIADDFDRLVARAVRQAPLADLVELRLDRIGHPGKDRLRACCRAIGKPVIVSCNGPEAYGTFAGSADELFGLYHDAAEAGVRFVDVDHRLSLDLGEVAAPCHRIVSRHEPSTPASAEGLDELLEELQAVLYEGDVTKLVTHAETCEDGLRLLAWLRGTKGIVCFAAGEAGRFTRLLAPIFGSPFTYCAAAELPGETVEATAPGQIRVNDLHALLPPGGVSQETAIFGVVGNPARHSWSPRVQGMALKAARLDAVYVAFEPTSLADFLALTTDGNYRGFSITAPFKEDACRAIERRDEASTRTGAVNTLVRDESGWRGANTDVAAVRDTLLAALRVHAQRRSDGVGGGGGTPTELSAARVLVLGTGGAARAAIWAVLAVGGRVTVAGRRPERAVALAKELGCDSVPWERIADTDYDALVHATPVGSSATASEGELPLPAEWLRPGKLVFDAVYRPIRTELLLRANERGCTPVPGGEWFVRQAALQFRLFTGLEPDEALMRSTFEHAHAAER